MIASIEDLDVIAKVLSHLDLKGREPEATRRPPLRAPPQRGLFIVSPFRDRASPGQKNVNTRRSRPRPDSS
jgi:hypothetical protein